MSDQDSTYPPEPYEPFSAVRNRALFVGVAALIIGFLGAFPKSTRQSFFTAYLYSYFFWLGISLGSLALVLLHHLVGGNWGVAVRRPAEAAALTTPIFAVLLIPVLFGVQYLYPWGVEKTLIADPVLLHQSALLNTPAAAIITLLLLGGWSALAHLIVRMGAQFDHTDSRRLARKMRKLCSGGICFHVLGVTILGVLWIMSREARWYSSILGFMILVGQALSAMVFLIIVVRILSRRPPMSEFVTPAILNDLGNLFLTLVILWAYMSFAQWLIVWMGNTVVDTPWYVRRGLGPQSNGWKAIGLLLIVVHFFIPFFLLLSRGIKRQFERLTNLAILVLVLRLVDVYWLIAPSSLQPTNFGLHVTWMDFLLPIGIGGIWLAAFSWYMEGRTMLPHLEPADEYDEQAQAGNNTGDASAFGAGH